MLVIALLLSLNTKTGLTSLDIFNSFRILVRNCALLVDSINALISASQVDVATCFCFLELQLIGQLPKKVSY